MTVFSARWKQQTVWPNGQQYCLSSLQYAFFKVKLIFKTSKAMLHSAHNFIFSENVQAPSTNSVKLQTILIKRELAAKLLFIPTEMQPTTRAAKGFAKYFSIWSTKCD